MSLSISRFTLCKISQCRRPISAFVHMLACHIGRSSITIDVHLHCCGPRVTTGLPLLSGLNRTEKHVKTFHSINLNEAPRAPHSNARIETKNRIYTNFICTMEWYAFETGCSNECEWFCTAIKIRFYFSHQVKFIAFRSAIERCCDGVTHASWILIMDWVDALTTWRHDHFIDGPTYDPTVCHGRIRVARFMLVNWKDLLLHFHLCSGRCSPKSFFLLFITLFPRSIRSGLAFDFNWRRCN